MQRLVPSALIDAGTSGRGSHEQQRVQAALDQAMGALQPVPLCFYQIRIDTEHQWGGAEEPQPLRNPTSSTLSNRVWCEVASAREGGR